MLLTLLVLFGVVVTVARMRRWFKRSKSADDSPRCACGYPLSGLDTARCPECGRVRGFNSTAEQLGLTTEELQRIEEVRKEREQLSRAANDSIKAPDKN